MGDTETIRCDSALPPTNKSEAGELGAEPERGGDVRDGAATAEPRVGGDSSGKGGLTEERPVTKAGSVHLEMATQGEILDLSEK